MLFITNRKLSILYSLLLIAGLFCIGLAKGQDCTGVVPIFQSRGVFLCANNSITLPSGVTVSESGTYNDTLRYKTGCDSVIFTFLITKKPAITNTMNISICDGYPYMLPSGTIVHLPGSYRDVIRYRIGCDSLITIVNLDVLTKTIKSSSVTICAGQPYALPSGKIINSPGIYNDTLYYTTGCDSLINIITVSGTTPLKQSLTMAICAGNSLILPSGVQVSNPGTYYDTIRYKSGCDSLITEVNLSIKPVSTETMDVTLCQGKNYTLPWGVVVNTAGVYRDTLRYIAGCDSVIRIVQLTISAPAIVNNSAKICSGTSYMLPSGLVVTLPGIYKDTLPDVNGCDSLIRIITVEVEPLIIQSINASICEGTSYNLPWGNTATIAGTYSDTLHYTSGCDSLIRSVQLNVKTVERKDSSVTICSGQTFIAPSGISIAATGIYLDSLRYATGCDSIIYRLSIVVNSVIRKPVTASVCDGSTYMLPSGKIISSAGNYNDTLRYASGCDSVIYSIQLITNSTQHQNTTINICSGQTYTLPWGVVVNSAGNYSDTLHYTTGCDSLIRLVQITVNTPTVISSSATICSGSTYTLPSGASVNAAGIYKDTLFYTTGCDSLIHVVNLSVSPLVHQISSLNLCEGSSVILPWGTTVSTPGVYRDTLYYTSGCDSIVNEVTVVLKAVIRRNTTVSFCAGTAYTLPWGTVVTTAGTYKDSLHYVSGCDSVITTVQLTANTLATITSAASICSNQSFTLPWGKIVSIAGIYTDTLRYASGCDSVIRIVDLSVNAPAKQIIDAFICSGKNYVLPWGTITAIPGTYTDTLQAFGGCDSLIRIVNLSVIPVVMKDTVAVLCSGQFFLSPTATKIYSAGLYFDTLRYKSGCDSIVFRISIIDRPVVYKTIDASVCYGDWYTLPSGKKINTAGTYPDTLQYKMGCDSMITTVNLSVFTAQTQNTAVSICLGKAYTLPWGATAINPGSYRDTLKNVLGCDSLVRIVQVSVTTPVRFSINAGICVGKTFTLPSGNSVATPGNFSDTIYNVAGCDSVIYDLNLTSITPVTQSSNITICAGRNYTLPWGPIVNSGGVYRDTVRSISGCDSMYRAVTLAIFAPSQNTITASVCSGKAYTLPSGKTVFAAGLYKDTLFSSSGCDSIITSVALTIQAPATLSMRASICAGQSYTLPWGRVVNTAGVYRDTLKYTTGCDSLIRVIDVQTISAKILSTNASFCRGEIYVLPWGVAAKNAGKYSDTLRTIAGCDSVIRIINLDVIEKPVVSVFKSNDINCTLGSAKLTASGGSQYQWSPAVGLDKTDVFNPLAAPATTTLYYVQVTSAYGCTSVDSVEIVVTNTISAESFLMPNAFTPNGDNLNDCFGVRHWGTISNLHFSVYDRWGNLIFYTENPSQCWDGNRKNNSLPSGTYVYTITAKTICGDVARKGTVTLIR